MTKQNTATAMRKLIQQMIAQKLRRRTYPALPAGVLKMMLAGVLLSLFLVGSCKTSDLAGNGPEAVTLLPPADAGYRYSPAKGYVHTARRYMTRNPEALMHMTEMQVSYLLGTPAMKRSEAPAEIWQYRAPSCVLDVYFYENDKSGYREMQMSDEGLSHHRKVAYYALRQLDVPDWHVGADADGMQFLPSAVQTSEKTAYCMDAILAHKS
jgi:hypothetical protein